MGDFKAAAAQSGIAVDEEEELTLGHGDDFGAECGLRSEGHQIGAVVMVVVHDNHLEIEEWENRLPPCGGAVAAKGGD